MVMQSSLPAGVQSFPRPQNETMTLNDGMECLYVIVTPVTSVGMSVDVLESSRPAIVRCVIVGMVGIVVRLVRREGRWRVQNQLA